MEIENAVIAEAFRKDDRGLVNAQGHIVGTLERYVLQVGPRNVLSVMRAVALMELREQQSLGNKPSQIIVDNRPVGERSINDAKRHIKLRFMDVEQLIKAVTEVYRVLLSVTRIQMPAKDAIVARKNFHLFIEGKDVGLLPTAIAKLSTANLTQDSVVRVVGPLVPYGRKLFWNPVGTSPRMQFRRYQSTRRQSITYRKRVGATNTEPNFKPYSPSTVKKLMRGNSAAAARVRAMVGGGTPPGRTENSGQIAKRILRASTQFRGLHFSDGWVNWPAAMSWSKLKDPRVPSISVQFSKRGATNI